MESPIEEERRSSDTLVIKRILQDVTRKLTSGIIRHGRDSDTVLNPRLDVKYFYYQERGVETSDFVPQINESDTPRDLTRDTGQ